MKNFTILRIRTFTRPVKSGMGKKKFTQKKVEVYYNFKTADSQP